MLQRLTLHGHGSGDRKFVLGNAKAMFFHPTLKSITLSCLNFDADMDEEMVAAKQNSTLLQSLTLVECNVNVQFLDVVLGLPKALKELSIGERLHVFDCSPSMDPKKRTSSVQFLTALQRQAESLQRLIHVGGQLEYIPARDCDPDGATKLRSLTKLETLELGFESHLNYYLRANGFPPSLKTLKMLDAALSLNSGPDMRSMADVAFHSITTLVSSCMPPSIQPGFEVHLHFSDHSMFRLFAIAHPAEQDRLFATVLLDRPTIYKIATILKSHNGKFLVMRETFPSGTSYIPPYMYGEETPVDQKMYDSDDYWRFSNIDYQYIDDETLRAQVIMSNRLRVCRTCELKGLGVESCRSADEGIKCAPCARSSMECIWDVAIEGDESEQNEAEAETEVGIQQVLFM
ncbi:hypothetical protein BDU57DRAFT_513945 [Ampelomyces quisqualis]|uniref:Uncharacterized protein n=1 Tax=Ampelomyces quisqualis TaxID=50730 RepID=A0A6A5QQD3_AMPQU|nr:hypothetical protein BDU57DRAFT_513945 [Ampelomyces quisqualis]